jgi:hypothetical protein
MTPPRATLHPCCIVSSTASPPLPPPLASPPFANAVRRGERTSRVGGGDVVARQRRATCIPVLWSSAVDQTLLESGL